MGFFRLCAVFLKGRYGDSSAAGTEQTVKKAAKRAVKQMGVLSCAVGFLFTFTVHRDSFRRKKRIMQNEKPYCF